MEGVVSSARLHMTTQMLFPGREGVCPTAALPRCCSLPGSRRNCAAFRTLGSKWTEGGRSRLSAAPVHPGLIAPEQKHNREFHVVAKVDVEVGNEPLLELSSGQSQYFHQLPSGLKMEVIAQEGAAIEGEGEGEGGLSRAPLVFVHGSYHGAWCWAVHWMPYFAARGHDCYAISLLGQGASDVPPGKVSFSLQSHAGNVGHFIAKNLKAPLVLIGHSFGGLIVQWFLSHIASPTSFTSSTLPREREGPFPRIAAVVLVCSTPPTGNGPMVKRFLKRDLVASIQITLSLAAKLFGSSLSLCRKSFFSADMPEADVQKYQNVLKRSSRTPMIDLQKLNDSLPLPYFPPQCPPVCVLAAENDFIVDLEGAKETADWYGTEPLVISGSAHDIMLDSAWEKASETLQSWLDRQTL